MTRVSIVIPCYNHARFLADAIESALHQTLQPVEVIVVDDGSTDASSGIVERYPGVTLLRQPNKGLSAARNAGLSVANGNVIIFLDADDRLWPQAAQVAAEVFEAHPAAAMIFGRCQVVDEVGRPHITNSTIAGQHSYEDLLRDNSIWTPAVAAFRRSVLDIVGGFDENNSPVADYDLYLRISRDFQVVSHEATVADYRQHSHNMSGNPVLMLEATLAVLRAQRPHVTRNARRSAAYREAFGTWRACYGERLVDRCRTSLKQGRLGAACVDAVHLLRLYPSGVRHHLRKKLKLIFNGGGTAPG